MNGHDLDYESAFDLRNDPDFQIYAAREDARDDFDHGVSMHDGIARLKENGATPNEIKAYCMTYGLNEVATQCGVAHFLPYIPF